MQWQCSSDHPINGIKQTISKPFSLTCPRPWESPNSIIRKNNVYSYQNRLQQAPQAILPYISNLKDQVLEDSRNHGNISRTDYPHLRGADLHQINLCRGSLQHWLICLFNSMGSVQLILTISTQTALNISQLLKMQKIKPKAYSSMLNKIFKLPNRKLNSQDKNQKRWYDTYPINLSCIQREFMQIIKRTEKNSPCGRAGHPQSSSGSNLRNKSMMNHS